jgi:hypothetical protein
VVLVASSSVEKRFWPPLSKSDHIFQISWLIILKLFKLMFSLINCETTSHTSSIFPFPADAF